MKKLLLALMMAFAVTADAEVIPNVRVGSLLYELDTVAKTAAIDGGEIMGGMTFIVVSEIEYEGETYTVTSVRANACAICPSLTFVLLPNVISVAESAFAHCPALTTVCLPKVVSVSGRAFFGCGSLTSVSLPNVVSLAKDAFLEAFSERGKIGSIELSWEHLSKGVSLTIPDSVKIVAPLPKQKIESGFYHVAVECGDEFLSSADYAKACGYYGIAPKTAPQIVQEGEIVITKESIATAKAEVISIEGGVVMLNVGVCSNGNFTAETASWKKAEIADAKLNGDGTVKLTVPVSSASGFMILQSGDAKVSNGRFEKDEP